MEENEIKSQKISLKKQFKIVWIVVAVILILNVVINIVSYSNYKKGQDLAATSLLVADSLSSSNTFSSESFEQDRKKTIRKMYNYLNPTYYNVKTQYGNINNSEAISAARKVESSLNEILKGENYKKGASYYLKYTGFFEFYFDNNIPFFIIYGILFLVIVILNIYYLIDKKTEIVVKKDILICKKKNGKSIQVLLKNITSVEIIRLKGLKVLGNGFRYKIILVKNNEEIRNEIMKLLSENAKDTTKSKENDANINELKKYKQLLDDGTITKEEFDKKKAELLNL